MGGTVWGQSERDRQTERRWRENGIESKAEGEI